MFKKKPKAKKPPTIETFDVTYLGCLDLPEGFMPGLESVNYALPIIQNDSKAIATKVSFAVSVYGLKAMRNSFAGIKQSDAEELSTGGITFDFVCNVSIYRVAFCADVGPDFCFISQDKQTGVFQAFAFLTKSKKVAQKVADSTALACKRVFTTLALLKARIKSLEEVDAEVDKARRLSLSSQTAAAEKETRNSTEMVALIHSEGFEDADEKFKAEMLELAGVHPEVIPYNQPSGEFGEASRRTAIRQADPNEYERTRF